MKYGILGLALFLASSPSWAAPADLEECYQNLGQVEVTESGDKTTAVFKDRADVTAGCDDKVVAAAEAEKDAAKVKELASIIGRKNNWGISIRVYTVLAKRDPKTACLDTDAHYALRDALSHPADMKTPKSAVVFLETCWPNGKDAFGKLLAGESNAYVKKNLCGFLKSKDAIPARRKDLCKKALAG